MHNGIRKHRVQVIVYTNQREDENVTGLDERLPTHHRDKNQHDLSGLRQT